ncbi:MAG: DUF1731 domain-containing protein, partial [Pseudomonadota bacterium]|nr:DUF1731 domain-containing protein [Pseudomonadota bacterium]
LDQPTLSGAINAVAPECPTQRDFARSLAAVYGRRVWLRVPATPLRWLGGEMSTLLLEGQAVTPAAAVAAGYRFRYPRLDSALQALAKPQPV